MKDALKAALKDALKARDQQQLNVVRGILSAIQYEEIEKGVEPLPNDQITSVLQREVKKRREELDFAEQAKRPELKDNLNREIQLIEKFLPKQLSATELEQILIGIKAENSGANFGAAMKVLKDRYAGQFDGKLASELARKVLG